MKAGVLALLAASFGLVVRFQGLRRYYALLLCREGKAKLVKVLDETSVLKEIEFDFQLNMKYELSLKVERHTLKGWLDGALLLEADDTEAALEGGAAGLLIEEGTLSCNAIEIQ